MATQPIAAPSAVIDTPLAREQVGLWSDAWRRLRRNRLALVSVGYLVLLVAVALVGLVHTPYPMAHQGVAASYDPPSPAHPLGGDAAGRDILSRLMIGAQISLVVGLATQAVVLAVGVPLGLLAGYFRGWIDTALSFLISVFYGIPDILVAMILIVILPGADVQPARARVHRGIALQRRPPGQDPVRPPAPERPGTDHRADDAGHPRRHPVRGVPELPGHRRPAADAVVGIDGGRWDPLHPDLAPHRAGTRDRPVADPDGVQLPGRRHPGRARSEAAALSSPLLEVRDLHTKFFTDDGVVGAVDGVSFELHQGEAIGIVGESGCGKSMTALSIMGLVPEPGRVTSGEVRFRGQDLLRVRPEDMREIRGRDIAMIFQDPLSSLNPVLRNGFQIEEAMLAHRHVPRRQAHTRAVELLRKVRVPAPEARARDYPHQLSGGMRQRTMIAMGLVNEPAILIADEPTTALDVTVQAQILELLRDLNREMDTAIIMITHNLGVVAGLCSRVLVMYAGRVVEEGPVDDIFERPQHPYTWALLRSVPRIDALRHERLRSIEGLPPDLVSLPTGCRFHPRCPFRVDRCFREDPPLERVAEGQRAACWVTMDHAYQEMGAAELMDVRPGAASGYHGVAEPPLG